MYIVLHTDTLSRCTVFCTWFSVLKFMVFKMYGQTIITGTPICLFIRVSVHQFIDSQACPSDYQRHGGLMVRVLDFWLASGQSSSPGWGHRVVSCARHLHTPLQCLSPVTLRCTSIPSRGSRNTPGNHDKLLLQEVAWSGPCAYHPLCIFGYMSSSTIFWFSNSSLTI